jgi:hypothetical protein
MPASPSVGPQPDRRTGYVQGGARHEPQKCPNPGCGDITGACTFDRFMNVTVCRKCGYRSDTAPGSGAPNNGAQRSERVAEPNGAGGKGPEPRVNAAWARAKAKIGAGVEAATKAEAARAEARAKAETRAKAEEEAKAKTQVEAKTKADAEAKARAKAEAEVKAEAKQEQPQSPVTEITLFTKRGGPLTKRIALDANGKLQNDSSACLMTQGTAQRVTIASDRALAELIGGLRSDQATALGRLRPGLPNKVEVVTKRALLGGAPANTITRTGNNIIYQQGAHGWALFDYDTKGMPASIAERVAGRVWETLISALPDLGHTLHIRRASTSAGLYRTDTKAQVPGSDGVHVYIAIKDASDSVRFLTILHERCWLAGLGWYMIGAGGQLLERSIVDRMVGQSERLVFEGAPVLASPLAQDAKARQPRVAAGTWLDTLKACPPLTVLERAKLDELKTKARHALTGESAKARDKFIHTRATELSKRTGASMADAKATIARQCRSILLPSILLLFDDPDLAGKTVADILANPAVFEGETLADPLEGIEYGRCKAKIMRREDGTPWVHSFAHGHTVYELKYDAAAVRAAVKAAAKEEAVKTFVRTALQAELDAQDEEALIEETSKRSGTGKRAIQTMLKKARTEAAKAKHEAERQQRLAERNDPRPMLELPDKDAQFLPVMGALNDVHSASKARIPPARNIEGQLVWPQRSRLPDTHLFVSGNEDADVTKQATPQLVIKTLSEASAAEMIERHIDFVDAKGRSVQLHSNFVAHYLCRDDGALPVMAAVSMLPMVSADGYLIYADGLDR